MNQISSLRVGALDLNFSSLAYLQLPIIDTEPFGVIDGEYATRFTIEGYDVLVIDHRLHRSELARVELWTSDALSEAGPVHLFVLCDARSGRQHEGGLERIAEMVRASRASAPLGA